MTKAWSGPLAPGQSLPMRFRRIGRVTLVLASSLAASVAGLAGPTAPAAATELICEPNSSWYEAGIPETSNEITHARVRDNYTGATAEFSVEAGVQQVVEAKVTAEVSLTQSLEAEVFEVVKGKMEAKIGSSIAVLHSKTSTEKVILKNLLPTGDSYVFYDGVKQVRVGWDLVRCNSSGTSSWTSNRGTAQSYTVQQDGAVGCKQPTEVYTMPNKAQRQFCGTTTLPGSGIDPPETGPGQPANGTKAYGVTKNAVEVRATSATCQSHPSVTNCASVIGTMNIGNTITPYCQKSGQTVGSNPWWVYGRTGNGLTGWIPSWWIDYPDNVLPGVATCSAAPLPGTGASFTSDARAELVTLGEGFTFWENTSGQLQGWPWGDSTVQGSGWGGSDGRDVWFADFDGDGRKDLVQLAGDSFRVWRRNTAAYGSWPWEAEFRTGGGWTGQDPSGVWWADINGDRRADLIQHNGDQLRYFPNLPGTWGAPVVIGTGWGGSDPRAVYFADTNADGRAEMIARSGDGFVVWPNANGQSGGWPWGTTYTTGSGWSGHDPSAVWWADITGDGRAEIVHKSGDQLRYFPNTGKGWGAAVPAGSGWTAVEPRKIYFA